MRKVTGLMLAIVMITVMLCSCVLAEGLSDAALMQPASAAMPLGEKDEPANLKQISSSNAGVHLVSSRSMLLREEALEPLYSLMRAAEADGVTLYVRQAYRSYADEARRYEMLSGMGQEAQKPGESSYQTGLSVTLVGEEWRTRELTEDYEGSRESQWLSQHAAEYGFVLRYPAGKESVTGWQYEPWHYRYVGAQTAAEMNAQGLCLDEMAGGAVMAVPQVAVNEPEAVRKDDAEETGFDADADDFDDNDEADMEPDEDTDDADIADDADDVIEPASASAGSSMNTASLTNVDAALMQPASAAMPLGEKDEPANLKQISSSSAGVHLVSSRSMLLREEALEPLYSLMQAAEADGVTLYVRQAYRSYADEARRYEMLSGMGQEAQKPGESSYQTGLSVTLVGEEWRTRELTEDYAGSRESQWLSQHAEEYGFVLRYPAGKESVTGWQYEPWHYRYVGAQTAAEMNAQGLCLDEMAGGAVMAVNEPEAVREDDAEETGFDADADDFDDNDEADMEPDEDTDDADIADDADDVIEPASVSAGSSMNTASLTNVDAALMQPASAAIPLGEKDEPANLKQISSSNAGVHLVSSRSMLLREEALEPLYSLMQAAEADGVTLYVRQAYRSYADEARRYEMLSGMGQEAQKPGESSYQTGLSVTLVGEEWRTRELTEDYAGSRESQWLSQHAAEYGFVLRYPAGKESVTGWQYEPWHYRYVGAQTAAEMNAQGLCLDELAANLGQTSAPAAEAPVAAPTPVPPVPVPAPAVEEADAPESGSVADEAEEEPVTAPVTTNEHSMPSAVDMTGIHPADIGPDGDYDISLFEY